MSCTGSNIFSTAPGKVVSLEGDSIPVVFMVDGDSQLFNDLGAIVTSIGYQGQAGFQFMHSMREFIYLYVFTERIGQIAISGLAFPQSCELLGPQDDPSFHDPAGCLITGTNGLERVLQWYQCNRITSRANPIIIAFGNQLSYDAFLISCKADITNPETGIAQFTMVFNFVPDIADFDELCFPFDEDCLDAPCT